MVGGHVWQGGMHGIGHAWQGVCVARGCLWQEGVHGRGHVWQGGMQDRAACVGRGVCMADTMRYGQSAGSTHPTGMHSCCSVNFDL